MTVDVCDWDGVDKVLALCVWLELCVCERLCVCVWDAVPVALELWVCDALSVELGVEDELGVCVCDAVSVELPVRL